MASKSAAPLNTTGGRHRPLTYYQTGGGAEIDFVIETRKRQPGGKPRVVCLEVKHAPCRTIRFSCSNFQSKRS